MTRRNKYAGRMVLPLSPWQEPHEPAHAMLAKAADLNVPGAARLFRRLLDNPQGHLVTNVKPDDVARFCSVDGKMLRHASPQFEGQMVTVMGQRFRASDYSTAYRRWCPDCLLETGSHRTWWDLAYVTSCPQHGIALSERCSCGTRPTWGNSPSMLHCRCGCELSSSRAGRLAAHEVAFDGYLIGRMLGERLRPVPRLDAMPMHEVIETARAIGRFVLDPFSEKAFSHTQEDRRRLVSAGFNAVLELPATVQATLERIYSTMAHMLAPPHFLLSGEFRRWLVAEPENGIKDAIRRTIRRWTKSTSLQIGPHDLPYGYFTLLDVAAVCDFAPLNLRKIMALHGKPPREPILGNVDPVTVAWLRHHVGNRRNASELAEELDVSVRDVFLLRREGLVKPFVEGTGTVFQFFSPDESGRLIARITAVSRKDGNGAGLRSLTAVSRSLGVPVAGLVRAVLEGKLCVVKSGDGIGLSGVLVDVEESASLASLRMTAACDGFASPSRLMTQNPPETRLWVQNSLSSH